MHKTNGDNTSRLQTHASLIQSTVSAHTNTHIHLPLSAVPYTWLRIEKDWARETWRVAAKGTAGKRGIATGMRKNHWHLGWIVVFQMHLNVDVFCHYDIVLNVMMSLKNYEGKQLQHFNNGSVRPTVSGLISEQNPIHFCLFPSPPLSHKNPCTLAPYHDSISKEINVAEGTEVKGNATHSVAFWGQTSMPCFMQWAGPHWICIPRELATDGIGTLTIPRVPLKGLFIKYLG